MKYKSTLEFFNENFFIFPSMLKINSILALICDDPSINSITTNTSYDSSDGASRVVGSVITNVCKSGYAMVQSNYNSFTFNDTVECQKRTGGNFE